MCTLAHVFEAAGMATVVLASNRSVAERMHPPRVLYCEFPLGRPLGRPQDPAFQRDVILQALALLERPEGPVLVDHPEVIEETSEAMSCAIPAGYDPTVSAAVAEARGLRKAYDRATAKAGVTSVGRVVDADAVPDALEVLQRLADGEHWRDVAIPGKNTTATVHDVRTYYEEAALELVEGPPPEGRAAEEWFYEHTEAGRTVMAARAAIKQSDAPFSVWFYMAPGHR